MSVPSSRSIEIWNAHELFELYNPTHQSFSCKGWAPSRGRRCHNPPASRVTVNNILHRLSMREPDETEMYDDLLEAAELSCCRAYHQGQADKIAMTWSGLVRDMKRTRLAERREEARMAEVRWVEAASEAVSTSSGHSRGRRAIRAPAPAMIDTEYDSREMSPARSTLSLSSSASLESFSSAMSSLPILTPSSPRGSIGSTPSSPSTSSHASVSTGSSGIRTSSSTRSSGSGRTASSIPSTSFSIPTTLTATTTSSLDSMTFALSTVLEQVHALQAELERLRTTRCSTAHVIRRSLTEDCAICYERLSDTAFGDLVWCKSQCGRSVHKECWEHWSRASTSPAKCVHW